MTRLLKIIIVVTAGVAQLKNKIRCVGHVDRLLVGDRLDKSLLGDRYRAFSCAMIL
jgi:hypothetical protein